MTQTPQFNKLLRIFTCLFCLCFLLIAQASDENPYQAQVPVASYAPADWQKAVSPALKQVLIKVSGNADIVKIPAIGKALNKPNGLVQSYNYLESSAGDKNLILQVRFSQKAINTLLQQANQPNLVSNTQSSVEAVPREEISSASQTSDFSDTLPTTDVAQPSSTEDSAMQAPARVATQPQRVAQPRSSGFAPVVEGVPVVVTDSVAGSHTVAANTDQAESFAAPAQDTQFVIEGEGAVNP